MNNPVTQTIHRHETHFECGCSTTRIELLPRLAQSTTRCQGHGGQLIKQVSTLEYLLPNMPNEQQETSCEPLRIP